MLPTNPYAAFYAPSPLTSDDPRDLPRYLATELTAIQGAIQALVAGHLETTNVAPTKPRDGDFRFADGTNWNPGSGKGFYGYYSSSWHFLG